MSICSYSAMKKTLHAMCTHMGFKEEQMYNIPFCGMTSTGDVQFRSYHVFVDEDCSSVIRPAAFEHS